MASNEETLEAFYTAGRQRPVLGTEGFLRWDKKQSPRLSREHPRYGGANVCPSMRKVMQQVAAVCAVEVSAFKRGRREEENHARKVAMYLVKRLCDLTLQDTAADVGVESYGVVGWACAQLWGNQAADKGFKKRVEQVEALISQQKT